MRHTDKKIISILLLICSFVGIVLFSIGYAKFILTHRTGVLVVCTISIIITMGIQCYLHIKKRKTNKNDITDTHKEEDPKIGE